MRISYRGLLDVVDKIDRGMIYVFGLLLSPFVLIGAYAIYDQGQVELGAIKAASLADEFMNTADDSVDFEAIRARNADIVAWIRIPDTNIDFPVMKGQDNDYYLSHDFEKNYAITGGIFLDYRNSADFSDNFSVIYGHRMSSGRMFSDVGKFEDESFFRRHPKAALYLPGQKLELEFVAFASVYGVQGEIYNIGAYSQKETIDKILESASIVRQEEIGEEQQYILLSTCSAREQAKRDVLLAKIEK